VKVVLFPEDGQAAVTKEIDGDLESMQALVDGDVRHMGLKNGLALLCNEDAMLLELAPNRVVPPALTGYYDPWRSTIRGPFFICREGQVDFEGLTDGDVERVYHAFGEPTAAAE